MDGHTKLQCRSTKLVRQISKPEKQKIGVPVQDILITWQEAQAAQAQTNDYRLDKNHTFAVSMYDDFDKYAKVTEEYAQQEEKAYVPRVSISNSITCWVHVSILIRRCRNVLDLLEATS